VSTKESSEIHNYPAIDIPYKTARDHYGGQMAALMDKLSNSKTAAKAKAMDPQDFKWSIVFNRSNDPPSITDPKAFTAYLCTNSEHWLKARGGGWKGVEEISITPSQIKAQYEQRANLICQQRKRDEAAEETEHESNGQNKTKELAENLLEAFNALARECDDDRLVAIVRNSVGMLIEDVLE